MGEFKIASKILTGKRTGKRLSGRSTRRWEDSIERFLRKYVGVNSRNWIHSVQDRDYWSLYE